jgi:hypothetical protein
MLSLIYHVPVVFACPYLTRLPFSLASRTGRGRGRRMEQSEYFDGGPDEYHPLPSRGELSLTYHPSLVFLHALSCVL